MSADKYLIRQLAAIGESTGERIKALSILLVGSGAAGNEISKNLALMGFGKITIVDFDHIEDSNLSRTTLFRKEDIGKSKAEVAAERLHELVLHESPQIVGLHGNIMTEMGKRLFKSHDVVICCVDTLKARAYINDWCVVFGTPFFEIGFQGFNADITFINPQGPDRANLRDLIGYKNFGEKRNSCSGLIIEDEQLEHIPTIQSTSAIAGGLLCGELIRFLQGESKLEGKTLKYYGTSHILDVFTIRPSEKPPFLHLKREDIHEAPYGNEISVRELLTWANETHQGDYRLRFPSPFVQEWRCGPCGLERFPQKFKDVIYHQDLSCENCRRPEEGGIGGKFKMINELHLNSDSDLLDNPLSYYGYPSGDIVRLRGVQSDGIFETHILLK
ncbi:MAG: ThiF family adenylyltransferase [Bacteroidota bacterium]